MPEQIKNAFECSSGNPAKDILKAGEYIGTEEYLLPVPYAAGFVTEQVESDLFSN